MIRVFIGSNLIFVPLGFFEQLGVIVISHPRECLWQK